jgi:hypothetical protein
MPARGVLVDQLVIMSSSACAASISGAGRSLTVAALPTKRRARLRRMRSHCAGEFA